MSYFLSNRKIMLITTKKTIIGFEINQDCFLEIEESKRRLLKRFSGVIEKGLSLTLFKVSNKDKEETLNEVVLRSL